MVSDYFSQQPLPGLTRDTAWHHILATAESQQAQELDQSLPKHKGARYINPILCIIHLFPLSLSLSLQFCMQGDMVMKLSSWVNIEWFT